MEKILSAIAISALSIFVLTSCGGTKTKSEQIEQEQEETDQMKVEDIKDEVEENYSELEWENEVGDTIKDETGTYTLIARNDKTEPLKSGPIILSIPQVIAVSAEIKGEMADFYESDTLDYIQIDMLVENTSDDTVTFYGNQVIITTNTGEQLESNRWMSDHIPSDFYGVVKQEGSKTFILEKSKAEDIEWVRIIISSPINGNREEVGEQLDFKIEL